MRISPKVPNSSLKEYLFHYEYQDACWGIAIFAEDEDDARRKLRRAADAAVYDGILHERIPVEMHGTGWFLGLYVRLKVAIRNFWHSIWQVSP